VEAHDRLHDCDHYFFLLGNLSGDLIEDLENIEEGRSRRSIRTPSGAWNAGPSHNIEGESASTPRHLPQLPLASGQDRASPAFVKDCACVRS
jgi:hypothetical protein